MVLKLIFSFKKSTTSFGLFAFLVTLSYGQLLEIDYTQGKREESSFRVQLVRTGIVGVSSLQHLDLTLEAIKIALRC